MQQIIHSYQCNSVRNEMEIGFQCPFNDDSYMMMNLNLLTTVQVLK